MEQMVGDHSVRLAQVAGSCAGASAPYVRDAELFLTNLWVGWTAISVP